MTDWKPKHAVYGKWDGFHGSYRNETYGGEDQYDDDRDIWVPESERLLREHKSIIEYVGHVSPYMAYWKGANLSSSSFQYDKFKLLKNYMQEASILKNNFEVFSKTEKKNGYIYCNPYNHIQDSICYTIGGQDEAEEKRSVR